MLDLAKRSGGWTQVVFGDVVRQVRDRVDPEKSGLSRYVAGEHMDTDDLRIRRWGEIGDGYLGPAFHMRFKPGHVLYGSRRTYLRKIAVADFEGITANTTFVLEPKNPNVLLPELLPFIMQTESFAQHSVRESKGSVNPYVNFSDLAWYKIALPPIEEQHRIARVLNAANAMRNSIDSLMRALEQIMSAASLSEFSSMSHAIAPSQWKPRSWGVVPVASLVEPDAPICYGIVQVGAAVADGVPTLAINDLSGDFVTGVTKVARSIESNYRRSRVVPGDVLLSIKGTIGEVAIVPSHFLGNISRDLARLRLNRERINPRYFVHLYKCPKYQRYLTSVVVGTTRAELSIASIRQMEVPLPDLAEQGEIAARLDQVAEAIEAAKQRATTSARLAHRLVRRCLVDENAA